MKASKARRTQQPFVDVREPGKGKALLHVLADGRNTGHYKLSERELIEVPEVWQATAVSDKFPGRWWEAVDTVALDVSCNSIQSVPIEISELADTLQTLNLSHNPIKGVPRHISALQQLKLLDVSGMALTQLPAELAGLLNLNRLLCQGNALTALPEDLGQHQSRLQQINCSSNRLQQLPRGLQGASALLSLDAAHNALPGLQPALPGAWAQLTSLDVSHNCLRALPETMSGLGRLTRLDASYNSLEGLPEGIGGMTSLLELVLSNNSIGTLPPAIAELQALKTLDLRVNRLTTFPEAACSLNLALLDLTNNDLASLPPQLGLMTSLRALPLSGNPLRGLHCTQSVADILRTLANRLEEVAEAEDRREPATCQDIRIPEGASSIDLKARGLQQVPDKVWASAAGLQRLDLCSNQIAALPPLQLAACTALQVLMLSCNAFTEWPLPACQLPSLRHLDLSGHERLLSAPQNALQCFAGTIQELDLSGTPAACCIDVSLLSQLQSLAMVRCSLTVMPAGVYSCARLRQLDLSSNRILEVHEDVTKLTALVELNLTNNNIGSLPPKLGLLCEKLKVLRIEGNPLRSIRRSILDKGTSAVLLYLQSRVPAQRSAPLHAQSS